MIHFNVTFSSINVCWCRKCITITLFPLLKYFVFSIFFSPKEVICSKSICSLCYLLFTCWDALNPASSSKNISHLLSSVAIGFIVSLYSLTKIIKRKIKQRIKTLAENENDGVVIILITSMLHHIFVKKKNNETVTLFFQFWRH